MGKYPILTINKTPGICQLCGKKIEVEEEIVIWFGISPIWGGWPKLRKAHSYHYPKGELSQIRKSNRIKETLKDKKKGDE